MGYDIIETNNPSFIPTMLNNRNVVNSGPINGYSILTLTALWRAVSLIAVNLASLPRDVYQDAGKLDTSHDLDQVLKRNPNQYQPAVRFWTTWFFHAAHKKAGYAKIVRNGAYDGAPIKGLYNLDPDTIEPFRLIPDGGEPEDGEQLYYDTLYKRLIPAANMLDLHGISYDGLTGYDPSVLHKETFERGKLYDRYLTRYIKKGTMIKAWLETEPGLPDDKLQEIVNTVRKFRGADSEDDLAVLAGAKLHASGLSPADSQLTEQIALNTTQISQVTGVPKEMLFEGSEAKYNENLEGMNSYFVTYTLRPWIEGAEGELTTKLVSQEDQAKNITIKLDTSALLRGDIVDQSTVVCQQVTTGLISKNQGRKQLGYPPDPNPSSDQLVTLGSTVPVDQTIKAGAVSDQKAIEVAPKAENAPESTVGASFEALKPLLMEAADRVERKSVKAFDDAKTKKDVERTAWGNVFAQQQSKYVSENFKSLAVSVKELTGTAIDVAKLAEQYAMEIKRRVAGNDAKPLADYVGDQLNGK